MSIQPPLGRFKRPIKDINLYQSTLLIYIPVFSLIQIVIAENDQVLYAPFLFMAR